MKFIVVIEEDGDYCSICGGIPPDKITTKKILIDGKATGIENFDFILENVWKLNLKNDKEIIKEIMVRVKKFNYVPTKKENLCADALLKEFMKVYN